MPRAVGYVPEHQRPTWCQDGLLVARRAGLRFARPEPYEIGEVLPAAEVTSRLAVTLWKTFYVDTLPADTKVVPTEAELAAAASAQKPAPPNSSKAAPPRGR